MKSIYHLALAIALFAIVGCSRSSDSPPGEPKKEAQASTPSNSLNPLGGIREVLDYLAEARRDKAKIQAKIIVTALKTWYIKYDSLPDSLEMLVSPPEGKPILDGKDAIVDPWGKPFQFAVKEAKDNQEIRFEVWTIDPDGKRIDNTSK